MSFIQFYIRATSCSPVYLSSDPSLISSCYHVMSPRSQHVLVTTSDSTVIVKLRWDDDDDDDDVILSINVPYIAVVIVLTKE